MPQGGKLTIETANVELAETYTQAHANVRPGRYVLLAVADTGTGMDGRRRPASSSRSSRPRSRARGPAWGWQRCSGSSSRARATSPSTRSRGEARPSRCICHRSRSGSRRPSRSPGLKLSVRGTETILLTEDEPALRRWPVTSWRCRGTPSWRRATGRRPFALRRSTGDDPPSRDRRGDARPERSLLAERLTALRPGIKVLYLSGYTDDAVVRHGVLEAATAFLQKPFTPSSLAAKVRDVLDQDKMTE